MRNKKLFIVDDEANIRNSIKRILHEELLSIEIIETGNGDEVLNLTESCKPDLILMDVLMPGTNGLELLKSLKSNANKEVQNIPVIMLTGVGNREVARKASELGAVDFITKPFNERLFLLKLRKYMK